MTEPRKDHLEALGEPMNAHDDDEADRRDDDFAEEHNDVTLADEDSSHGEDGSPHGLAGAD